MTTVWQCIDNKAGVWVANYRVSSIGVRTVAVRLLDDSLLMISPGRILAQNSNAFFAEHGQPSWILAPNSLHQLGIEAWRENYSGLQLSCSNVAQKRLLAKKHGPIRSLDELRPYLSKHTQIHEVPGSRTGEVLVIIEGEKGPIWVVCDAFFNAGQPRGWVMRILTWIFKMGPGLVVSRQFRYILVKDWPTYRTWITQLLTERAPAVLVPSHGKIISPADLKEQMLSVLPK